MKRSLTVLALSIVLLLPTGAWSEPDIPADLLSAYLESARAGDWETAASYWLPEDVTRATRLGITYRDIPFKLDCSSYLMVPGVGDAGEPTLADPVGDPDVGPVRIRTVFDGRLGSFPSEYVFVRDDDRWRLASMATALGRDWPVTESRYLRFRVQPGRTLNPVAVDYLDDFVERCGARLGLTPERMSHLAEAKIDYLLCDEGVVEAIAGAPTKGVAMLPTDAVVTSERAHTHELAHVLVGYAAEDLGLYVLPVLQEGIAVHLGGRWGKSAAVQEEMGRYVLDTGFAEVEAMLTWRDFRQMLPDLSYAPAGLLAGYLLEELGPEGFLELYRNLSGWSGELAGLDSDTILEKIMPRLGNPGTTLGEEVSAYSARLPGGGIEPGAGGFPDNPFQLEGDGLKATVTVGESWVQFELSAKEGEPAGAVMIGSVGEQGTAGHLFAERFPGREYRGERGAVIFNGREAGYYDFALEVLTAKYVYDFRPDPSYLWDSGDRIAFRVRRNLLPEILSEMILVPSR